MLIISILSFRDSFLGIKFEPDKTLDTWPQHGKQVIFYLEHLLKHFSMAVQFQ